MLIKSPQKSKLIYNTNAKKQEINIAAGDTLIPHSSLLIPHLQERSA